MHHRSNGSYIHASGAGSFAAGRDQHFNVTVTAACDPCDRCRVRLVRSGETYCPACVGELRDEEAKQGFSAFLVCVFASFVLAASLCGVFQVPQERFMNACTSVAICIFMLGFIGYAWLRLR